MGRYGADLLFLRPCFTFRHGGSPDNLTAAAAADAERLAHLLADTDADGFFGDTITASGLQEFYQDSVRAGRPAAIQPEVRCLSFPAQPEPL